MASERTLRRDVVCPFCGLACDDLVIEQEGERLRVKEGACGRSRDLFERPPADAAPQIAGKPVALEAAIARAAELLRDSRLPLFAGLATDVDGMRAVMQLADRIGGVVDHSASDALLRNLSVLRDTGWVTITLSEVRNRMDLLVVFGHPPDEAFPRFTERCVRPPRTLFSDEPPLRQVIRIGPPAAGADPSALELPCAIEQLPEVAAALKSLVAGHPLPGTEVAGLPAERLQEVAECLRAARYGVVAWAAAEFDFAAAELTIQALSGMVQDLNRTTRCALLPLTGTDNLIGVNQVCLWQGGFPVRTGFGPGFPEHDPYRFSAERLIESAEADALVWISAFRPAAPPASPDIPTILIATADTKPPSAPDVFIPVGTPGLDHGGQIFRMDSVVALRLTALRESRLPSVADVISRIDAAIAAKDMV